MHSDDFERMMFSWAEANMIDQATAEKAVRAYRNARRREEAEAAERLAKYEKGSRSPFMRLMAVELPLVGGPVFLWATVVYLVAYSVIR